MTQTAVDVRPAVLEHRQVLAQLSQVTEVNSGKAEAWSLRAASHHCPPGVHHHAVPITCSLLVVASTLGCCYHVALGFDGTGPQQHLGVRRFVSAPTHATARRKVAGSGHGRLVYLL